MPVYLSVYAGAGHGAKVAAEQGGFGVVLGLADSTANNVGSTTVDMDIRDSISSGRVRGVGIALVCSSWSIARRAPEWSKFPSPLRGPSSTCLDSLT